MTTLNNEPKLKNCPHCGTIAFATTNHEIEPDKLKHIIMCMYCAAQTRPCDTLRSAQLAWNKRKD